MCGFFVLCEICGILLFLVIFIIGVELSCGFELFC